MLINIYLQVPGVEKNTFGMISLNGKDKIRLIDMSPNACEAVKNCIQHNWAKGLKDSVEHKQVA